MRDSRWLVPFAGFVVATAVAAQAPLTPTSDVVIPTGGVLHYSTIQVPAGVTVTFQGSAPAIVRVDGDVDIAGTVQVRGSGNGWAVGGSGYSCSGTLPPSGTSGGDGRHAGVYGSAMPFTLEGGSAGGAVTLMGPTLWPWNPCNQLTGYLPGGAGGGALVLTAAGHVQVGGTVDADGTGVGAQWPGIITAGSGSGGCIRLVGGHGLTVAPGAQILARGAWWASPMDPATFGYVRIDSLGGPPSTAGNVIPAPLKIELPHLRAPQPASIGTQWPIEARSMPGDAVLLAISFGSIPPIATPFGTLGIDLGLSTTLGIAAVPMTFEDPAGLHTLSIPNLPSLVGSPFWVQGIDFLAPGSPRLTNVLDAVIAP